MWLKLLLNLTLHYFQIELKPLRFNIRGNNTKPAAAGDGTPSKKFIFHVSFSSITVKLNLAKRRAQHTA